MKSIFLQAIAMISMGSVSLAQNVGINTTDPERSLEVEGTDDQFVRIQTTTEFVTETAVELINGTPVDAAIDWKISNNAGMFSLIHSHDNFNADNNTILRIGASGQVGIRSTFLQSRLQINSGTEASNAGHGFMVIGSTSAINMVMDQNEINVRSNGSASTLFLQEQGGHTIVGLGGGNTYYSMGGGNVGIGTSSVPRKLSVDATGFQVHLRNTNSLNDWYIGASNSSWLAGDNQLLFSPGPSSDEAVFRLMDVSDNDGETAPVMITSSASQTLLLDGNEIDSKHGPLYINHNSHQNTIFNTNGGRVGIGTSNPGATLFVDAHPGEMALRMQVNDILWNLQPNSASGLLMFIKDGVTVAQVHNVNGQWLAVSDRRLKKDLQPLSSVLDGVRSMGLYTYNYIRDKKKSGQYGVMAQEIANLFPQAVQVEEGEYTVSYAQLSVIALKALQEQQQEIDLLENELQSLLASKHEE